MNYKEFELLFNKPEVKNYLTKFDPFRWVIFGESDTDICYMVCDKDIFPPNITGVLSLYVLGINQEELNEAVKDFKKYETLGDVGLLFSGPSILDYHN